MSGGDRAFPPAQPFWGRFLRALFLLAIAAIAHVWVDRAPVNRFPPTLATAPGQPGINAVVQALGTPASAQASSNAGAAAAGVTVRTELIPVTAVGLDSPQFGARPLPAAVPQPVGTAGVLAANQPDSETSEIARAVDRPVEADATPAESAPQDDQPKRAPEPELTPLAAARRSLPQLAKTMAVNAPVVPSGETQRVIHAAPIVEPDQQQLVTRVLQQYASAYERLDVAAAKMVYPAVNDTALRRAFSQLEAQRVTFESCGITISGQDANARCQGENAYLPRVGSRTLQRATREWTFDLAKADDGWHIVRATVR
jgi:hypothetical protein